MSRPRAPFEALDAYQSGLMPDAEATQLEEELFAAAAAGADDEARLVDLLARLGQFLLPRGGWDIGSTRARVDELVAAGLRVQVLSALAGAPGEPLLLPKIDDDAQLVVTHVPIDVRGYDSVDVVVEKLDGTELKTFRDIGFEPSDGTVYALCEAPLARIAAKQRHVRSRILGMRGGRQHVVAVFETRQD